MLFPLVPAMPAVSVSVALAALAVTPVVAGRCNLLIAAATFPAIVAAVALVAKVPVVLPMQLADPAKAPATAPNETSPGVLDVAAR